MMEERLFWYNRSPMPFYSINTVRHCLLSRSTLSEAFVGVVPIEPGVDPDEVEEQGLKGTIATAAVVVQARKIMISRVQSIYLIQTQSFREIFRFSIVLLRFGFTFVRCEGLFP